ncbi:high affinity methionine permease [Rhodofomes roseus]|uniref:High affinity methionine permease n=1 Tax=Rhodofomes roseus TaxID=34475 RepID=A0ABQ8KEK7_9APHY|nr:high affinity methionine permease [Rhodofomes roseus]KAH9836156.1 high affinity methionine permease [Rhodofomes roseus]
MSLRAFKSRLASFSARGRSLEPSEDADGVKDVDEKLAIKDDVGSVVDKLEDPDLAPGELTYNEATAGGMGRHLGVFTCTMLIVGHIIGTGIFSTPSSILESVGSVGASMMLWVLGFALSFCGLFIWLEFGTMIPRSGGEKVYLEAAYKRPRHLATIMFATNAILLGFTASNCIVFASNILEAAGATTTRWNERGIAIGVIVFVTILHGFTPHIGIILMNLLSVFKIVILVFIVIAGWVVLSGRTSVADPHANFRNAFAGSSQSSFDYATATFKVLYAYGGWSSVNYVMNNVRDPVRTLKISAPLGLTICAVLYLLANVAYFAAATKEEIANSGVTVASLFFAKVFGPTAQKALTVFVALSALGNVITVTFSSARVNQELAKEGIPLPFGNRFWASNWPTGKTPMPGLIIHLIPSVIVILAPPPNIAYPFILDVEGYPSQIINLFVVIGLFWLRYRKPNAHRPFKVWWPLAVFYLAAAVFLLVAPFIRPPGGVGDTPPLPYYLYCLVGIAIMFAGVLWWAGWRVVPRWFGYKFVARKEALKDGTVVSLFSIRKIE